MTYMSPDVKTGIHGTFYFFAKFFLMAIPLLGLLSYCIKQIGAQPQPWVMPVEDHKHKGPSHIEWLKNNKIAEYKDFLGR